MIDNSQEITTAFHILLTGNCVLKPSVVLSFLGKYKIRYKQLKLTKTTGLVHEPVTTVTHADL